MRSPAATFWPSSKGPRSWSSFSYQSSLPRYCPNTLEKPKDVFLTRRSAKSTIDGACIYTQALHFQPDRHPVGCDSAFDPGPSGGELLLSRLGRWSTPSCTGTAPVASGIGSPTACCPKSTVKDHFAPMARRWHLAMGSSAPPSADRVPAGKEPSPGTGCIDSHKVKATKIAEDRGYDGGKKITGPNRHIIVDALGLVLVVWVRVASSDDARLLRKS